MCWRAELTHGIARDCSGIANVPIFAGPGLLGIAPGLQMSQFLQVRDCSGLVRDCKCPNFCRSGIARDGSGIASVPIFAGPGLPGIAPGSQMSQCLQVRECSGLLPGCKCPNFCRSGIARDCSGVVVAIEDRARVQSSSPRNQSNLVPY